MNMKHLFTILLAFLGLATMQLPAAEVPAKIGTAGAALTSMEASFTHVKTVKATGKSITFTGTYYYTATDRLAMHYAQDSEGLVLNADRFFIRRGGKANKGHISKVNQMEKLSALLFSCIRGEVQSVADENNATLAVKSEKSAWVITLTAKKKASKGYAKIVLRYRQDDGLLESLRFEEFNGNVNEYTLKDCKAGVVIPAAKFDIPKK